jgi:hypothetical protein
VMLKGYHETMQGHPRQAKKSQFTIAQYPIRNPKSAIRNPQSLVSP